jgi:hypothetical protein
LITLLILSANPSDTDRLALDREARAIKQELRNAAPQGVFRVEQECAVRIDDLHEHLLRYQPTIVHFSGHGNSTGALLFEGATGEAEPVGINALADLFKILRRNVRCVVLNACFSEAQARVLAKHIDCVIGAAGLIDDVASIAFSKFYMALGFGQDVETAFELARNRLQLCGLDQPDLLRLWPRDGVLPSTVRLIANKKSRSPK